MIDLITDRTEADVLYWQQLRDKGWAAMSERERGEWLGSISAPVLQGGAPVLQNGAAVAQGSGLPLKGAYTTADLNRVEGAVAILAAQLHAAGLLQELPTTRVWQPGDTPNNHDMVRYLSNIRLLLDALPLQLPGLPALPTNMAGLTHTKANRIERVLQQIDAWTEPYTNNRLYAGEIYGGEA